VAGLKPPLERWEQTGWTKRFIACEPRLSEAVAIYRKAGFDVHLEPLPQIVDRPICAGEEKSEQCWGCFKGVEDHYRVLFTRPMTPQAQDKQY
jgi:hypothetical protein